MNNNLHKKSTNKSVNRITTMTVASIYPHYVAKIEKKGRTKQELHQVIEWLTGINESTLIKISF